MYCIMKFMRLGSWHHHQTCETDHSAPMDHANQGFSDTQHTTQGPTLSYLSVSPFLPLTYLVCWLDGFLRNRKPEIKQIWLTIRQFSGKEQTQIAYFSFQRIISQNGLAATLYGHIFYFNPLIVPFIWIRFFKR